jgi:hypothetical protein
MGYEIVSKKYKANKIQEIVFWNSSNGNLKIQTVDKEGIVIKEEVKKINY